MYKHPIHQKSGTNNMWKGKKARGGDEEKQKKSENINQYSIKWKKGKIPLKATRHHGKWEKQVSLFLFSGRSLMEWCKVRKNVVCSWMMSVGFFEVKSHWISWKVFHNFHHHLEVFFCRKLSTLFPYKAQQHISQNTSEGSRNFPGIWCWIFFCPVAAQTRFSSRSSSRTEV